MDYLSLKAAVNEAGRRFTGHRVRNSGQVSPFEAVLHFQNESTLLLSIDPSRPGLFILGRDLPLQDLRTPFSELLSARISGTVLVSVRLHEHGERVVFLDFRTGWPARLREPLSIALEVMGRHSNLAVLQGNTILQPLKPLSDQKSRVRPILSGERWEPPPSRAGVALEDLVPEDLPALSSPEAVQALVRSVRGLSPHTAGQAVAMAAGGGTDALYRALTSMTRSADGENGFLHRIGDRSYLTSFEPVTAISGGTYQRYTPFSIASSIWRDETPRVHAAGHDVKERLAAGLRIMEKKLKTALGRLDSEWERCQAHEDVRLMAETLLIHASRIKKGITSVILPSPFDPDKKMTISLDPAATVPENAARMFTEAQRMERGLRDIPGRRTRVLEELARVKDALARIQDHGDTAPAEKLISVKTAGQQAAGTGSFRSYKGPGRRYAVEGFTILVGRSALDNERVTFSAAGPNDLWLHARDYPGSHVVVLGERKKVPDKVLYRAAQLAADASGARNETAPEIMVTERKWVRKVKGGKPGKVTVERFRTVRPKKDR